MQKICCQGNRGESESVWEREAEIPPEYQDCRCRRRAQRSTLSAAHFPPVYTTLVTHLKARSERFKCQRLLFLFLSAFICLDVTAQNSIGCNSSFCISPCFSPLVLLSALWVCLSIYRPPSSPPLPQFQFLSLSVYTCLLSHLLSVCQSCFNGTAVINYTVGRVGCTV